MVLAAGVSCFGQPASLRFEVGAVSSAGAVAAAWDVEWGVPIPRTFAAE